MGEFKTVSLADQVFERLEDDIITGKYPRGTGQDDRGSFKYSV